MKNAVISDIIKSHQWQIADERKETFMDYTSIRSELTDYYMHTLADSVENLRVKVYEKLDAFDRVNPGLNSFKLKAQQYRTIAETFEPVLFNHEPFFFETGAIQAYGDGCYTRGGRHPNGWLFDRNNHIASDRYPETCRLFWQNMSDVLYLTCGLFFDTEHTPIPMKKIFSVGLSGVYEEAREALTKCTTDEERDFVEAAIAGLESIKLIGEKFAAEARRRLETETDPENIRCFTMIANTAGRVPWEAPKTFYEGMATIAFMRKAIGSIEGYGYNSVGRPDVLIAPLMENDRKNGATYDEMYDLMCRFMLIWDCHVDHDKIMSGYADYEYENSITIGGVDRNGNEVFNDVTRMFVESALGLDLIYPKLMCRFSSKSSDEYLKLISRPSLKGKNIFIFENDDVMIKAQMRAGFTHEEASDYVVTGCWGSSCDDYKKVMGGEYLNILRTLEWSVTMPEDRLALNHLEFRPFSGAKSFEELYQIFLDNTLQVMRMKARLLSEGGRCWKDICPMPVTSALMMYPLKNRHDISDGGAGFAREQFCFAGFPDVVDSLLAMKRMCFDEKICTVEDVIEQCRNDWQDESLRHMAVTSPAFGDDSEESDALAARLNSDLYRISRNLPTLFGGEFEIGHNMYTEIIWWGQKIGATPNGRRAGSYIAHGITPTRLHEIKSVTDTLRSIKAAGLDKCSANSVSNVMLPAAKMDEDKLSAFMRACALNGVAAIQINCVSRDELLAAQKEPEKYRHIVVRVTGFSCPFVMLSKQWQEEVLSRNYYD